MFILFSSLAFDKNIYGKKLFLAPALQSFLSPHNLSSSEWSNTGYRIGRDQKSLSRYGVFFLFFFRHGIFVELLEPEEPQRSSGPVSLFCKWGQWGLEVAQLISYRQAWTVLFLFVPWFYPPC